MILWLEAAPMLVADGQVAEPKTVAEKKTARQSGCLLAVGYKKQG
jgi:hypothetical protein